MVQEYLKNNTVGPNTVTGTSTPTSILGDGNVGPIAPPVATQIKDTSVSAPVVAPVAPAKQAVTTPPPATPPIPRVTPTPTAAPVPAPATQSAPSNAAADYLSSANFTPPPTEEQNYKTLLDRASGVITGINQGSEQALKQKRAGTAGVLAGAGLGGSSAAQSAEAEQESPIIEKRNADLANVYSTIQSTADTLTQSEKQMALGEAQADVAQQQSIAAKAKTDATDAVKTMAASHLDWQNYKQTNPDNYNALVKSLGGDPNYADALFAASIPPQNIQQSWVNGSTYNQLSTDPLTGKPSIQTYDLGVKVPQSWTADKIGTNAVIYHGPNWDPKDPSTYQMFALDPLTGIPTNQIGGTPNPTAGDGVVNNVVNMLSNSGITVDPAAPIDPTHVDDIASALIQHENSQIDPSLNNPGDIKFAGIPGQIDSGIKASDGGTWAKYETKQDGTSAVSDIVRRAAQRGSTFGDFIKSYTGTGSTTASIATSPLVQSWVNNVKNGNATLMNVPAAIRNAVSEGLNSAGGDSATYTPLAASRFTNAANRIVANYIAMPAYQLVTGGQLYLGRINAALQKPGSISDQDLLDSLTKLNTGGNAISDAQVKLITDGKSFSDSVDTAKNKLTTGGVLSNDQRQQIHDLAKAIFKSYQTAYQPIYNKAIDQLQAAGIPKPFWTIPDVNTLTEEADSSGSENQSDNGSSSGSTDTQTQAESQGFDYQSAKNAGYSDEDIQGFLAEGQ